MSTIIEMIFEKYGYRKITNIISAGYGFCVLIVILGAMGGDIFVSLIFAIILALIWRLITIPFRKVAKAIEFADDKIKNAKFIKSLEDNEKAYKEYKEYKKSKE